MAGLILVVDDLPEMRWVVRKSLKAYEVLEAGGVDEALALPESRLTALDLALLDVVMPGASGQSLVARLHALNPALKVVYMSGYGLDTLARYGVPSGAHFLAKPFTPADLRALVARVLDPGP